MSEWHTYFSYGCTVFSVKAFWFFIKLEYPPLFGSNCSVFPHVLRRPFLRTFFLFPLSLIVVVLSIVTVPSIHRDKIEKESLEIPISLGVFIVNHSNKCCTSLFIVRIKTTKIMRHTIKNETNWMDVFIFSLPGMVANEKINIDIILAAHFLKRQQ